MGLVKSVILFLAFGSLVSPVVAESNKENLSIQCFDRSVALEKTKPEFTKTALSLFSHMNFLDDSSTSLQVGSSTSPYNQKVFGTVRTIYYDVTGSSHDELKEQMRKNVPYVARLYAGETSTEVNVDGVTITDYYWRRFVDETSADSDMCTLRWANFTNNITYYVPRWINRESASEDLKIDWANYMAALVFHLEGYAAQSQLIAQSALEKMLRLKGEVYGCRDLKVRIDEIGEDALHEQFQRYIEYNVLTKAGETQGANFERRSKCSLAEHREKRALTEGEMKKNKFDFSRYFFYSNQNYVGFDDAGLSSDKVKSKF